MTFPLLPIFRLLLVPVLVFGKLYEDFKEVPKLEFDFIIVGGGTAGNVIANRLTENPKFSVLVLEAGGTDANLLNSSVPAYAIGHGPSTRYDWNYTTTPQVALNGRTIGYARGFLLGGSSSINWMAYTRGTSDDFDRYAATTKDDGWSWKGVQKYIRKNERFVPPADGRNVSGDFDPKFHSFTGITPVSLPGFPVTMDGQLIGAAKDSDGPLRYNVDLNSGAHLGFGWAPANVGGGERSSSSTAYLAPKYLARPNLHVLLHARVIRVLPSTDATSSRPSFRKLEILLPGKARPVQLEASKEVVISAGTFNSPHLLLHSGIGDQHALKALGIRSLHHLPSVGRNMSDHSAAWLQWQVSATDTTDAAGKNATLAAEQLRLWKKKRQGPLVNPPIHQFGYVRLAEDADIFGEFEDPASGKRTGHVELLTLNGGFGIDANAMSIASLVVSPAARGTITINSTNPLDAPLIDPNLFGTAFEFAAMRHGLRTALQFVEDSTMAESGFLQELLTPVSLASDDAALDAYIREAGATAVHPVGTCAMTAKDAGWGVVDPDLRVKGVDGLRIIDASVMPFVPAAHTMAPTYIIAERAADIIKEQWAK